MVLLESLFRVPELQTVIIKESFRQPDMVKMLVNTDLQWKVAMFSRAKSQRPKCENLEVIRQVLTYVCQ